MEIKFEVEYGAIAPVRAHATDAGFDLTACEDVCLKAGIGNTIVHTGVHVLIPEGYYGLVAPRSGLARSGIVAEIGIIDAGYTGEICVTMRFERHGLHICGKEKVLLAVGETAINAGDRIAQLLILPLPGVHLVRGKVIGVNTERGANGFGSTGVN